MHLPWQKYRTLNRILVSSAALKANLKLYRDLLPGKSVCPVLKSNAYGHGLTLVAKTLDAEQCDFFIVDSLYEAYELKKARIKTPILILGYNFEENLHARLPFHFTAHDLHDVEVLHKLKLPIHIEINSGFNRSGFHWERFEKDLEFIRKIGPQIEGIFTHLACADEPEDDFTTLQSTRFLKTVDQLKEAGFRPKWIHVANSAGSLKLRSEEFNMVRLGFGLYGTAPLEGLQPAMEFHSTLVDIQSIRKGDRVGYGVNYTAEHDQSIGVIAAGYYEGIPLSLSNVGHVEINGVTCPILGRVCMNHCMVSLKGVTASVGDDVLIYSSEKDSTLCVNKQAEKAQTSPYELLARLSQSVKRQVQ